MIFFRLSGIKRAVIFKTALLILLFFCAGEIHASAPVDISSKAGFDGKFRKGKGLPLRIILQNREERTIEGILRITGGDN